MSYFQVLDANCHPHLPLPCPPPLHLTTPTSGVITTKPRASLDKYDYTYDCAGATAAIYAWHPEYVDSLAVRMRPAAGGADEHFFTHDALYNVTSSVSDANDQVVERYHYSPYGEAAFLTSAFAGQPASTIGQEHLYTGRERDAETGLQLNRHRWYHAGLGRWVSRDPIGYDGGSDNLYSYSVNSPVLQLDTFGLVPPSIGPFPNPGFQPRPSIPTPEGWPKSCKDYAFGLPTINVNEPHSEGQYRHCVAACCLMRRGGCLGSLAILCWDGLFENPYDEASQGDMAAEKSGKCVAKSSQSCKEGCKAALNNPKSPCHPKPYPPAKVNCYDGFAVTPP